MTQSDSEDQWVKMQEKKASLWNRFNNWLRLKRLFFAFWVSSHRWALIISVIGLLIAGSITVAWKRSETEITPSPVTEQQLQPSPSPTISPTANPSASPAIASPSAKQVVTGETTLLVTAVVEEGETAENAHILLRDAFGGFVAEGYTDLYGNYGFGQLKPGEYVVQGGLYGDLPFSVNTTVEVGKENRVTLALLYKTSATITGHVRFNDGEAISGAKVTSRRGELCATFGSSGEPANSSGRYELNVSEPGEYCVTVTEMDWGSVETSDSNPFMKHTTVGAGGSVTVDFSLPRK